MGEIYGDMQRKCQRPEELSFHGSETTESSSGSTSSRGSGNTRGREDAKMSSGRREVVAMACQPCRKRKTKCDGQRPICSACVQRGHTNCYYDSSSDMRRTSALKKRIEGLLEDIDVLKGIILTLTRGYNIPQDPLMYQAIEQTLLYGKWGYLRDLYRQLDAHTMALRQAVQPPQDPENQAPLPTPMSTTFQPQYSRAMPYTSANYSPVEQTTAHAYQPAVAPQSWSPIDVRTTPGVYGDVAQPNPPYLGPCAPHRPLPTYPVSSNSY